jgi:hypothetical protein
MDQCPHFGSEASPYGPPAPAPQPPRRTGLIVGLSAALVFAVIALAVVILSGQGGDSTSAQPAQTAPSSAAPMQPSTPAPVPVPTTPTPQRTAPIPGSSDDIYTQAFNQVATDEGLTRYGPTDMLRRISKEVICEGFDSGLRYADVVSVLSDPTLLGMTDQDAGSLIGLAIVADCPRHGNKVN